ncbi:MAG: hypothetical protein ABI557_11700 [Aureliella sp.]
MSIDQQLDMIEAAFGDREVLTMANVKKAFAILDQAPAEALQKLVDRKVKFLWKPAQFRLNAMKQK